MVSDAEEQAKRCVLTSNRHLSSVGALLTVAAVAMQTFVQLMPSYVVRPVVSNGTATVSRCGNFSDSDGIDFLQASEY